MNKLILYRNLKPWQLFLLLFSFAMIDGMIPIVNYNLAHLLLNCSSIIVYFHWIYLTSKQLINKTSFTMQLSWRFFIINYVYALIWICFILMIDGLKYNDHNAFGYLLTPFHVYGTFCLFYFIWFMSKSLTSLEANKVTTGKEILNTFFLFGFLPIGIWWLQPRIREVLAK